MTGLSADQIAIRDMTSDFVRQRVIPFAGKWDRDAALPPDTLAEAGALGLFGVCVDPDHGGAGADLMSYVLVTEELAYGDAGFCNVVNATNAFAMRVNEFGTREQKRAWLEPVAAGRHLACMLLTEPHTGSDASAIRTRAKSVAGGWRISGAKSFITSGQSAGAAVVLAVTDPTADKRRISAFLARPGAPGYRVLRVEDKLGQRASETCQIALEGLQVGADALLGEPGRGLRVAFSGLETGRIAVAAQAVGIARAALEAALGYAGERESFGRPIREHQAIGFRLADMATAIEAARALCHHAARLKQTGVRCVKEASMAKLMATQMCERVCSDALQIHGGTGYMEETPVSRYWRDARVLQIYDGTNEIQKIVIARELESEARTR